MADGFAGLVVRLTVPCRELRRALDAFGISRNALAIADAEPEGSMADAPATLTHPSVFTSDVAFVSLLAHVVRQGLPMRLELVQYAPDSDDPLQQCCLYPGLDDDSLTAFRAIDPSRADDHAGAQTRALAALRRLQTAAEEQGFSVAEASGDTGSSA